jgi:hypothetical protein
MQALWGKFLNTEFQSVFVEKKGFDQAKIRCGRMSQQQVLCLVDFFPSEGVVFFFEPI